MIVLREWLCWSPACVYSCCGGNLPSAACSRCGSAMIWHSLTGCFFLPPLSIHLPFSIVCHILQDSPYISIWRHSYPTPLQEKLGSLPKSIMVGFSEHWPNGPCKTARMYMSEVVDQGDSIYMYIDIYILYIFISITISIYIWGLRQTIINYQPESSLQLDHAGSINSGWSCLGGRPAPATTDNLLGLSNPRLHVHKMWMPWGYHSPLHVAFSVWFIMVHSPLISPFFLMSIGLSHMIFTTLWWDVLFQSNTFRDPEATSKSKNW